MKAIVLAMGFQVKGTLGLFVVAYRLGLMTQVEIDQAIARLGNSSVRLSPRLVVWLRSQLNA